MAFIVDIILVAVLALCIFLGWKKGFVKAVSGFLTYILSFAIANFCWRWISGLIGMLPFIKNMVTEGVEGPVIEEGATFFDKLQTALTFFGSDVAQDGNVETTTAVLKNYLADTLTMIISFIVIFIIAVILLKLVFKLLDSVIKKIPLVKQCNGLLGAIIGFLNGSIWTWAIANIFVAFLPVLNTANPGLFPMEVADSFIITLCTKINPITYIFQFINWLA